MLEWQSQLQTKSDGRPTEWRTINATDAKGSSDFPDTITLKNSLKPGAAGVGNGPIASLCVVGLWASRPGMCWTGQTMFGLRCTRKFKKDGCTVIHVKMSVINLFYMRLDGAKKLTYVLAFSKDEVQDVSWRYSAKHAEMLGRRNECRESWLVQVVHRLWKAKEPSNSPERNEEMKRRLLIELVEFMTPKSSDGQNLSGRTTGSLAWRMARGEIGSSQAPTSAEPFVFKLTEEERKSKVFHVKYSCAKDEYIRVSKNSEVIKPFSSCANKQQNVFRKEERDWKMAYLARTEGSSSAEISWKFDFSGMEIDKIEICTSSQTFENGVISWRLCSKNQCAMLTGDPEVKTYSELSGEDEMTLTAILSGGKGEVAWQHTQMFRQKIDDTNFHPLDVKVFFK